MKMKLNALWFLLIACGLAGCQSKVAFVESDEGVAACTIGHYDIKAVGEFAVSVLSTLKKNDPQMFAAPDETIAEPITLKIVRKSSGDAGGLVSLNNLMSLCTLTLWPYVDKTRRNYSIVLKSPYGEKNFELAIFERKWTSLSPICLIPYPASGDWRGDGGELFCEYENAKLAEVIKGNLVAVDYDRYRNEESKRRDEARLIREIEIKRIADVKKKIEGMFSSKHWKDVISVCDHELKATHQGAEAEDCAIWTEMKKRAENALVEEADAAEKAAKAAEEAKRKAFDDAVNREIAEAIAVDRRKRLQLAKSELARTANMKDAAEKEKETKRLMVEVRVLEKLLSK